MEGPNAGDESRGKRAEKTEAIRNGWMAAIVSLRVSDESRACGFVADAKTGREAATECALFKSPAGVPTLWYGGECDFPRSAEQASLLSR